MIEKSEGKIGSSCGSLMLPSYIGPPSPRRFEWTLRCLNTVCAMRWMIIVLRWSFFLQSSGSKTLVVKGLLDHVLLEREEKDKEDEVPMAFWHELYADTRFLHMQIDVIGNESCLPFLQQLGVVGNQDAYIQNRWNNPRGGQPHIRHVSSLLSFQAP